MKRYNGLDTTTKYDIEFRNHGSIVILIPLSVAGKEWCDSRLPEDGQRWANGYVVEPRYVVDIINGMEEAGLTVVDSNPLAPAVPFSDGTYTE